MRKTGFATAAARSGLLAVVAAALTPPLMLLVGAVLFYIQAQRGRVDPAAGFEPNLFLRTFALPLSGIVFVVTFLVGLWRVRRAGRQEIGSSGPMNREAGKHGKHSMSSEVTRGDLAKAAAMSLVLALGLAVMVFVPVWFVLAFASRLMTGQIHRVTFVLAGAAAGTFLVWVFRLAFVHFRKGEAGSRGE